MVITSREVDSTPATLIGPPVVDFRLGRASPESGDGSGKIKGLSSYSSYRWETSTFAHGERPASSCFLNSGLDRICLATQPGLARSEHDELQTWHAWIAKTHVEPGDDTYVWCANGKRIPRKSPSLCCVVRQYALVAAFRSGCGRYALPVEAETG